VAHRDGILKRVSAVVDLPQRVTVNINHGNACNLRNWLRMSTTGTGIQPIPKS
jgi:hypothetical protein